jgi:hypothetical protein
LLGNKYYLNLGADMEVTGMSGSQSFSALSVLKTANEQPRLAGELISKSVDAMMQNQSVARSSVQPVDVSGITGTGRIINTTA